MLKSESYEMQQIESVMGTVREHVRSAFPKTRLLVTNNNISLSVTGIVPSVKKGVVLRASITSDNQIIVSSYFTDSQAKTKKVKHLSNTIPLAGCSYEKLLNLCEATLLTTLDNFKQWIRC